MSLLAHTRPMKMWVREYEALNRRTAFEENVPATTLGSMAEDVQFWPMLHNFESSR